MKTPISIFFNNLLISVNLYQHAKNQTFSSFCSRDIVDLKILQSDWPKTFWHISQEPNLFQDKVPLQIKLRKKITTFSDTFIQRTLGLFYFPNFLEQKYFFKNPALS